MDSLQSIFLDINQLIPIVNHWFHLVSAVIWIGGLAFLAMAVKPAMREGGVPKEYVRPIIDAFYRHYKRVAGILLVVLLFTGGINVHYVNQVLTSQTGQGMQHHGKYLWIFCIKLLLVLCLLTLFLYTVPTRRLMDGILHHPLCRSHETPPSVNRPSRPSRPDPDSTGPSRILPDTATYAIRYVRAGLLQDAIAIDDSPLSAPLYFQ